MQFFRDLWNIVLNNNLITIPNYIKLTDIVEISIISFLAYSLMVWIKTTRAWSLLKGVVVIAIFILVAAIFEMNTILWIVKNVINVAVLAIVVILQPELRRALEVLGRKNIISSMLPFDTTKTESGRFSDHTITEIVKACSEMGQTKTGALIVIEQDAPLQDYVRTGIEVDAVVSSQLLVNIFEHNTPLHDGAVIIRGDRILAATCYLPLSDNQELSKELGTRHRAGVGISEICDAVTIIVSEESGRMSVAHGGRMNRLDAPGLKERLKQAQDKKEEEKKPRKAKKREAANGA